MMEEGMGGRNLESMGDDMETNVRGEVRTTKSKTSSEIKTSGKAELEIRQQEQPGEERS